MPLPTPSECLTPPPHTTQSSRPMTPNDRLATDPLSRRRLLKSVAAFAALPPAAAFAREKRNNNDRALRSSFDALKQLGARVKPIVSDEYQARVARVQQLLAEQKPQLDAVFVAPGTSLYYFTGARQAQRAPPGTLIPQKGTPSVCPALKRHDSANNFVSQPKSESGRKMKAQQSWRRRR